VFTARYGLIPYLLLLQLYNSLWVLACSVISFHCLLSCAFCFQIFTPIFLMSFLASFSHLNLGLPFGLVAYDFHLYIVLATLTFGILSTCPNQLKLLLLMFLTIFSYPITFPSFSFVLIPYINQIMFSPWKVKVLQENLVPVLFSSPFIPRGPNCFRNLAFLVTDTCI
jgi:hypothetical protein